MTAYAAYWFLPAVIPIAIYVSWSDMRYLRIPNMSVYALLLVYGVLGLFALPFDVYLWQWLHMPIMLAVMFLFWMSGVMGGGDAKFIAAASPMFSVADIRLILALFAACLLAGLATHRLAKYAGARRIAPDWQSWDGKRFPKGFPLSMTLLAYLGLVAVYG